MRRRTTPLAEYMADLTARLEALSPGELRDVVLAHAGRLPAAQRDSFAELFAPAPKVAERADLMEDIADLSERLAKGEFYEGWGWDSDLGDERPDGHDSWAEEMDELFVRAGELFLARDWPAAREAYQALLSVFRLAEDGGVFAGDEAPWDMVTTDVGEAWDRYLVALYHTTPSAARASALLEQLEEPLVWHRSFALRGLMGAAQGGLPELDSFVAGWTALLRRRLDAGTPVPVFARLAGWLADAAEVADGSDGLAGVARHYGHGHPRLYLEWVGYLREAGRAAEAIAAAREGVASVTDGRLRAQVADAMAGAADEARDLSAGREAAEAAWRAEPSLSRLTRLCAGAGDATVLRALARAELAVADAGTYTLAGQPACALQLLAGDLERPVAALAAALPLGWSHSNHPGYVVLPYLLLAAAGQPLPAEASCLAELLAELDTAERLDSAMTVLRPEPGSDEPSAAPGRRLSQFLVDLAGADFVGGERLLDPAAIAAARRVRAIVSNGHRGAYRRAALAAAAVTEAYSLAGKPHLGWAYLTDLREEFPRHRAFQQELDDLIRASSLLPNTLRRR